MPGERRGGDAVSLQQLASGQERMRELVITACENLTASSYCSVPRWMSYFAPLLRCYRTCSVPLIRTLKKALNVRPLSPRSQRYHLSAIPGLLSIHHGGSELEIAFRVVRVGRKLVDEKYRIMKLESRKGVENLISVWCALFGGNLFYFCL